MLASGMARVIPALRSERDLNRRYLSLVALQELALMLPLSVMVVHMTSRGLDLAGIGLAFALRALMVVLLELPTGGLADAIGRKPVGLLSQAFTLASFVILLFITGPITALFYAVLQGIGAALHSGSLEAWYIDSLKRLNPEAALQQNLARVEVVSSFAMLIGSGLGGVLPAWFSSFNLPWPLSGFGISIFISILLRILVWILTVVLIDEVKSKPATLADVKTVPMIMRDAFLLTRQLPVVPYLLFSMLASGVAMISLETFWQPLVGETLGVKAENSEIFGLFGVLIGLAVLLGSFVVMKGAGRLLWASSPALAAIGQVMKGGAIILLALGGSGFTLGSALTLAYFAMAANNAPHEALLNEAIPSERRSVMLSLHSLSMFLGIALGSSLLGWLASMFGTRFALFVGGGFTVLASLAYIGVVLAQRRKSVEDIKVASWKKDEIAL